MFRLSGVFSIVLAAFCGALLFWTSQSVQRAEKDLSEVSRDALSEGETLRVLSAEWDYLNRPERLEKLTGNNLDLDAPLTDGKVFVDGVDKIPEPVVPVLPKMKPANLLQYVSTKKKELNKSAPSSVPSSVIKKNDSQNFDGLLNDVLAEDAP